MPPAKRPVRTRPSRPALRSPPPASENGHPGPFPGPPMDQCPRLPKEPVPSVGSRESGVGSREQGAGSGSKEFVTLFQPPLRANAVPAKGREEGRTTCELEDPTGDTGTVGEEDRGRRKKSSIGEGWEEDAARREPDCQTGGITRISVRRSQPVTSHKVCTSSMWNANAWCVAADERTATN